MNLEDIYFLSQAFAGYRAIHLITEEELKKPNIASILSTVFPNMQIPFGQQSVLEFKEAVKDVGESISMCIEILNDLSVSLETQNELKNIENMYNQFTSKEYKDYNSATNNFLEIIRAIHERSDIWEDRIRNGLNKIPLIIPFVEGIIAPQKMLKGAKSLFDRNPAIWDKLQGSEKSDLEDFIRCYLSQAWTPAGIMVMRVIESAVRKYYKDITKTDRKESWGYLLKDLEENYSDKTDKKLIEELSYIRKHIRNPLAHPEDLYKSHEEADIAFVHAKKVLTSIYS